MNVGGGHGSDGTAWGPKARHGGQCERNMRECITIFDAHACNVSGADQPLAEERQYCGMMSVQILKKQKQQHPFVSRITTVAVFIGLDLRSNPCARVCFVSAYPSNFVRF